jgi:hypothetical protein
MSGLEFHEHVEIGRWGAVCVSLDAERKEEIMLDVPERYLTDADGNRIGVVLDMEAYQRLIQAAVELADIRAYVEAKQAIDAGEEELIPIDQAVAEYQERHGAPAKQAS